MFFLIAQKKKKAPSMYILSSMSTINANQLPERYHHHHHNHHNHDHNHDHNAPGLVFSYNHLFTINGLTTLFGLPTPAGDGDDIPPLTDSSSPFVSILDPNIDLVGVTYPPSTELPNEVAFPDAPKSVLLFKVPFNGMVDDDRWNKGLVDRRVLLYPLPPKLADDAPAAKNDALGDRKPGERGDPFAAFALTLALAPGELGDDRPFKLRMLAATGLYFGGVL